MNESLDALMGTIGENNRQIKKLLRDRHRKIDEVNVIMDQKARNKTPLNERQRQSFHEFTGVYAQEGGNLKQTLMGMENAVKSELELHTENSEALLQSLTALHGLQKNAIYSLRRLIASSESALSAL